MATTDSTRYTFIGRRAGWGALVAGFAAVRVSILLAALVVVFMGALALVLARIGSVVDGRGVEVRNLRGTRRIEWSSVESVGTSRTFNRGTQIVLGLAGGESVRLPAPTSMTAGFTEGMKQVRELWSAARGAPADAATSPSTLLVQPDAPIPENSELTGIPGFDGVAEVGRGGFSVVYRARQVRFDRSVAVKVLAAGIDEGAQRRFERECAAVGNLSWHPHVVTVFDSGATPSGRPYLVMEYAPAGSLGDRLVRAERLAWGEAVDVGVKIAGALEAAHRAGRVHRDVKPDNVLLNRAGEPVLADFGIATVRDAAVTSSPASVAYAAPEILEGEAASVASDVYGLGITCFALLAGRSPFSAPGDSIGLVVRRVQSESLPDLRAQGVPDEVCRVLEIACDRDPAQRPATAAAFGELLRNAQRSLGVDPTRLVVAPAEADTEPDPVALTPITADAIVSDGGAHTRIVDRNASDEPLVVLEESRTSPPSPPPWRRPVVIAGAAALLVVVGAVGLWLRGGHDDRATAGPSTTADTTAGSTSTAPNPTTTQPANTSYSPSTPQVSLANFLHKNFPGTPCQPGGPGIRLAPGELAMSACDFTPGVPDLTPDFYLDRNVRDKEPRFDRLQPGDFSGTWKLFLPGTTSVFASGRWAVRLEEVLNEGLYEFTFRSHIRCFALVDKGTRRDAAAQLYARLRRIAQSHHARLDMGPTWTF